MTEIQPGTLEEQISKILSDPFSKPTTFHDNKHMPIHGWYSYTEGFSAKFVASILDLTPKKHFFCVDPFAGSSTTGLEVIIRGGAFEGYEINPIMNLVGEVKTVVAPRIARAINKNKSKKIQFEKCLTKIIENRSVEHGIVSDIFRDKPYFKPHFFTQIQQIRKGIKAVRDEDARKFFLVALLSILVEVSNLKRSPDLKYKQDDQQLTMLSPKVVFRIKAEKMLRDINSMSVASIGQAKNILASGTTLSNTPSSSADIVLTSPPYLNGTNYIRNTKLELWIAGELKNYDDMRKLNEECITCSINTSLKREFDATPWDKINRNIERVRKNQYDPRISSMVAYYFLEMAENLKNVLRILKKGASAYYVIGDSAFNQVHIPVHDHLMLIALDLGFKKVKNFKLRDRKSRGGMKLREDLLILSK